MPLLLQRLAGAEMRAQHPSRALEAIDRAIGLFSPGFNSARQAHPAIPAAGGTLQPMFAILAEVRDYVFDSVVVCRVALCGNHGVSIPDGKRMQHFYTLA
jgi:hypothetical protein